MGFFTKPSNSPVDDGCFSQTEERRHEIRNRSNSGLFEVRGKEPHPPGKDGDAGEVRPLRFALRERQRREPFRRARGGPVPLHRVRGAKQDPGPKHRVRTEVREVQASSPDTGAVRAPAAPDHGRQFSGKSPEVSLAGPHFCLGAVVPDLQILPSRDRRICRVVKRQGQGGQAQCGRESRSVFFLQHPQRAPTAHLRQWTTRGNSPRGSSKTRNRAQDGCVQLATCLKGSFPPAPRRGGGTSPYRKRFAPVGRRGEGRGTLREIRIDFGVGSILISSPTARSSYPLAGEDPVRQ